MERKKSVEFQKLNRIKVRWDFKLFNLQIEANLSVNLNS